MRGVLELQTFLQVFIVDMYITQYIWDDTIQRTVNKGSLWLNFAVEKYRTEWEGNFCFQSFSIYTNLTAIHNTKVSDVRHINFNKFALHVMKSFQYFTKGNYSCQWH